MTARDGFLIQPPVLSAAGSIMSNVVYEMNAAADNLRQDMAYALMGPGNETVPWGTDDVGREFGQQFGETVGTVWPSVESYRHQIDFGARVLLGAATTFENLSIGGAATFGGIGAQLPGGPLLGGQR